MSKPFSQIADTTTPPWQQSVSRCLRSPREVLQQGQLLPVVTEKIHQANELFTTRAPLEFLRRATNSERDPLLLQVMPSEEETKVIPGYSSDPLHEAEYMPLPGLLHKYHGRVLLIVTGACPIHCRYCFRRHFPYSEASSRAQNWQPALDYIKNDTTISEVILSGGDPLMLPDNTLAELSNSLQSITHLERLRIHTRMPAVIPSRVCDELTDWLAASRLTASIVMHINHAREIDLEVKLAFARLRRAGVTLLNQSVLLKDINDNCDTLAQLSEQLFAAGVLPYYLHQLDRVNGAAHFEVSDVKARKLLRQLRKRLPGYLVPKLVREQSGTASKTALV